MKRGKRYIETTKLVGRATLYDIVDAVVLMKETVAARSSETTGAHLRTGCDGCHASQQVRSAVVLPHGTDKATRILVFARGLRTGGTQAAGADFVGGEGLVPRIQSGGWLDFDVVVATPDTTGVTGRLGRVFGPRGLVPNPKTGTVTMNMTKAINDIKAGKIGYRLDKTNITHVPLGKASFTEEQLIDSLQMLMDAVINAKPSTLKGTYTKSVTLSSTVGPGVKLNVGKLVNQA